jgi:cytochrome c oxidase cbb3-type subunit 3
MSQQRTSELKDRVIVGYEYDGITEYDNPCPKWLMYIFYFTLLLAVFYLGHHFGRMSPEVTRTHVSVEETEQDRAQGLEEVSAIDETALAALLQDPEALAAGKEVYHDKCDLCHGDGAEGLIGPNMIDNYWLHGKGTISDIAHTIRYGVAEKGMSSWEGRITEERIFQTAAYIKSLQGTSSDNPKEPQGELIEE